MAERGHPRAELQELLDERIASERRSELRAHVSTCETCRRELEALQSMRLLLRGLPDDPPDAAFTARLQSAFDAESRRPARASRARGRILAALVTGAVAAGLVLWGLARRAEVTYPSAAIGDYQALRTGKVALQFVTADAGELEHALAALELGFRPRVLDLAMMGWRLEGGRATELPGARAALFSYVDAAGRVIVCEMYWGTLNDLPEGGERFESGGFSFVEYQERGLRAIFWAEGSVICVLVGDLPEADLRALAIAKAMRPNPRG